MTMIITIPNPPLELLRGLADNPDQATMNALKELFDHSAKMIDRVRVEMAEQAAATAVTERVQFKAEVRDSLINHDHQFSNAEEECHYPEDSSITTSLPQQCHRGSHE
jgi:hypothetical protein